MEAVELPAEPDAVAPDGSDVRVLVGCRAGSMAHFELGPNEASVAVAHQTLEEMWYFIGGHGEMWRKSEHADDPGVEVILHAGVALTIPAHTHFQFRSTGMEPLEAIGVAMPPWPGIGDTSGRGEAYFVEGPWQATVQPGMEK